MNYQNVLDEIYSEINLIFQKGKVADYIPALAKADINDFAMSLITLDGEEYNIGCSEKKFSIQSISKVFTFILALKNYGVQLYERVGHEPSGNSFNSLVQLEYENGIPRNPFINAGAIVITDTLMSIYKENTTVTILDFLKKVSDCTDIDFDEEIYKSELEHGFRNIALINMMKSFKNIRNNTDDVIQAYFKQCSIMMNTRQLARSGLFLANHGINPLTKEEIVNTNKAKRINSVMLTCGHYDSSGDFAYKVGIPAKSGVGGGILAIVPKKMALCVYAPGLNDKGNSLIGSKALELFTSKTGLSIF